MVAIGVIERALATARQGQLLQQGLRVVLVGRPNVGKSSLLNAWSGSSRAIVTDVGSTKRSIVAAGERLIGTAFVGSHPMAGSERSGLDAATDSLLENRLCIVTPTERTPVESADRVDAFWTALGMRTTRVFPADHDRLLADVSHLPHLIAAAVVALPDARGAFGHAAREAVTRFTDRYPRRR